MAQIIWTNHARDRINDRKIPQSQILQAISSPDSKFPNSDGSIEVVKQFGSQKAHAIIKENEKGEFIILSCWVNPPNFGTADFKGNKLRKDMKKASPLKKIWYTVLSQLGF